MPRILKLKPHRELKLKSHHEGTKGTKVTKKGKERSNRFDVGALVALRMGDGRHAEPVLKTNHSTVSVRFSAFLRDLRVLRAFVVRFRL